MILYEIVNFLLILNQSKFYINNLEFLKLNIIKIYVILLNLYHLINILINKN